MIAVKQPQLEQIESGVWSDGAVAQNNPDVYAVVEGVLRTLDLVAITTDVLGADRQADKPDVMEALDFWFGEIADSYADEDDA